jgi:probable rRNA maturation factor
MTLGDNFHLDILLEHLEWETILPCYEHNIVQCLEKVAEFVPEGKLFTLIGEVDLSFVLCNDTLMRELNKAHRGQNKTTNVLSFQGMDTEQINDYLLDNSGIGEYPHSFGEIFISAETMIKEALSANISLQDHFMHITIHGILHLLGYDHVLEEDANVMEKIETELLAKLGIDDPYHP